MKIVKEKVPKGKTYSVGVSAGRHAYASTLAGAKKAGTKIGRLTEKNDKKWNSSYVLVAISKAAGPGRYASTHWYMAVPVRGSGARRSDVVTTIRKKFNVAPYKWFKY